jgi:hypothetical protein
VPLRCAISWATAASGVETSAPVEATTPAAALAAAPFRNPRRSTEVFFVEFANLGDFAICVVSWLIVRK